MARHKRKPPQIITERPLDATTRKFLEKRDGVKNINWATQEKMDAIVAKKRKAEEEELYNSSDLRRKQQRLDVEEAARMPMLRGESAGSSADLDFDLPFSPSTSVAEANARELERAQKVRARRRAQRARKVAREYARGEVVFERALGLINDEVEKEALRLINSGDTEKAMRLVDDGKERKADEAKKLEEVKEVQDGGTGVKTMAKAEVKALKRARRTRRGSAEDARGDVVVDEMLGLISSKDADEALRVIDSVETEEALALDQGNEANASTTTQELEREEKVKKSNSTRRARQRVAHYDRENIMEGEALALSEFPEKMETPETSTDTETAQLQQRVEKAKAARKVRRASQKAARLAQEDLDWAEGFGPAAHKEMMETLAMSSETEAAEEQKWRDHEIEANRLERGKRKAAQFARGEIWWDELLGLISCREAEEALAALVEDNEAKGERLRGARRRAARYARGEVLVDDEALGLVEGEETTEERTEAGRAKRAGSLQNMQQEVEAPHELQAPSKEKAKPRPPPRRQEEEEEEDCPPPKLTRRKQARVLAKKAARRQKADAETAAAVAVR